jgi:hypothetical protein
MNCRIKCVEEYLEVVSKALSWRFLVWRRRRHVELVIRGGTDGGGVGSIRSGGGCSIFDDFAKEFRSHKS